MARSTRRPAQVLPSSISFLGRAQMTEEKFPPRIGTRYVGTTSRPQFIVHLRRTYRHRGWQHHAGRPTSRRTSSVSHSRFSGRAKTGYGPTSRSTAGRRRLLAMVVDVKPASIRDRQPGRFMCDSRIEHRNGADRGRARRSDGIRPASRPLVVAPCGQRREGGSRRLAWRSRLLGRFPRRWR